jgi:hypothetical protein
MLDQAPGRKFKVVWHGTAGWLPYGLFGLLAGMSAALGFLVPPRSRVTAKRRDGSRAAARWGQVPSPRQATPQDLLRVSGNRGG